MVRAASKNVTLRLAVVLCAVGALSACDGTDIERGALGAGAGAIAANLTGSDVAAGALIGGAAGVVCDDVTPQVCGRR